MLKTLRKTPRTTAAGELRSDAEQTEELRLIALCLKGDQSSWETLITNYSPLIYGIAARYGLSEDDRAEVFQTVCLALWRSLKEIKDPRTLPGWRATVTGRTAWKLLLDRRKTQSRGDEDDLDNAPDETLSPEERLVLVERWASFREAVKSLDERCQLLLQALFFNTEEPSYEAIAQHLCIPKGSVGPTRARCLEKLKHFLVDGGRV